MSLSKGRARPPVKSKAPATLAEGLSRDSADPDSVVNTSDAGHDTGSQQKSATSKACSTTYRHNANASPRANATPPAGGDYSLRRIIELYGEQADLLRVVLSAKTEQDRARAEYERRVQEEWRYETRRVEFEMMLHGNYFKQQEREYEQQQQQQQQQQNRHMGVVVSGGMHREIHSPIGPLQQQQQQQPPLSLPPQGTHHHPQTPAMATPAGYGSSSHDPYRNVRSYHHPDTPGGLDGRNPNPFAFFKMPLGAPLHHPSAYPPQQKPRPPMRDRKVAPAISGLSVRIVDHGGNIDDGNVPQSAPVDGPAAQAKRKISHDEVIMALRRKVMAKGGSTNNNGGFGGPLAAASAATSTVSAPVSATAAAVARQSSLGIITNVAEDVDVEEAVAMSSSSSESSDASALAAINEGRRGGQQQRLPSISDMLESESTRSS
ncbi:hypothetical protein BX661DRAFT_195722 [Kickxella alabastrina]|uniref:uncharacterized protein n=1 Tax=Kickxella alabastrina TaxID=61397 RepID=UPI00221E9246|nr:uncharacterized protein BX661DRAFT_195722 [Kickxella alabastrina]KAI7835188.1 hypothetical protein BX661DRAFT_195722 [Kickxella alabastrina]KAJ1947590.1 hypothetical protein GGF37_000355 [Kickxella alabastrina]